MEQALLRAFPNEIAHVWCRIGTAEVATDPMGVEETDIFIALKPRALWSGKVPSKDQNKLRLLIMNELEGIPGQNISFSQLIKQRMDEMTTGSRADVAVKVYGDNLEILDAKADEIEKILKKIPGCGELSRPEQTAGQPVLQIRVRPEQLARYGMPARQVLDLIQSLGDFRSARWSRGSCGFPLVARLPENFGLTQRHWAKSCWPCRTATRCR